MKPKLIVIFLLIVLVPLGLVVWLGVRVAHNEQEIVLTFEREHRVNEVMPRASFAELDL